MIALPMLVLPPESRTREGALRRWWCAIGQQSQAFRPLLCAVRIQQP
jgi:hypothetical protein